MIIKQVTFEFLQFLHKKAETLRDEAGHNGSYTDGGASALDNEITCYGAGKHAVLPVCWNRYWDEYEARVSDAEYATYVRLKEKFGS